MQRTPKIYDTGHAISYIAANSTSNNLPYHGIKHLLDVFSLVSEAFLVSGLPPIRRMQAELAALFHDTNHLRKPDSYSDKKGRNNIGNALDFFDGYSLTTKIDSETKIIVPTLIKGSYRPYEGSAQIYNNADEEMKLMIDLFRESDLLQSLKYYSSIEIAEKFAEEQGIPLDQYVLSQRKFLPKFKEIMKYPVTARGHNTFDKNIDPAIDTLDTYIHENNLQ